MNARPLLLEIGMEECPARFVGPALADLERIAAEQLAAHRLPHGRVRALGTPRRLSVWVEGVADRQEDVVQEVKGPPARSLSTPTVRPPGRLKALPPIKGSASRI